ncbi:Gluconokinase [Acidisarcina polymorpha]|uniref:Gluconokinase n=1 Tax=Acidisarcina polymorpha TaxID=2211140 RepID=A0A2Z5FZD2_9BACT|nr:gluconokinase [Acidisarcina polymorpha]AXC11857.1 Gluconokinase [Acidisarcina polymorpha]
MIVILMGVTGTGKTTVGKLLASRTGWPFAEGDDYHSEANKQKMHAGIPLNDEDRAPWLATLHDVLYGWYQQGKSGILACSALKQAYRDTLSSGIPRDDYRFVLLEVSREHIAERLSHRTNHYMNPGLLDSQFATLEVPSDAIRVSAEGTPEETVALILDQLGLPQGV